MNSTTILDLGTGSEVNCPVGSATVLRYGTCSSEADAINLLVVKVRIERGASGGTGGHIILRINASAGVGPYTVRAQKMLYIDATQNAWNDTTIILLNASGMVVEIMCTSLDNSVYLTSDLVVYQYKVHTHGITNPSHSTGMTNPAHATGMTNPAHATGITNPSHGHGAIDPAHEH
jgi:hypothetical protein